MAHVSANRVRQESATTGTGTYALGAISPNMVGFEDAIGIGNTCWYGAVGDTGYEIGIGTVGSGTLARTSILESSNSDAAVSWAGAGPRALFVMHPVQKQVYVGTDGQLNIGGSAITLTDGVFLVADGANIVGESGATARASLGLVIGTNVQAWTTPALDQISALAATDGNIVVGDGANWVAESGATLRASIGLGTAATVNVGLSGATIPLLSGDNVFSGDVVFGPDTDQNMQIAAGSGAININILNDAFSAYTDLVVQADQIQMNITSLGIGGVSPGEELYVSDGCQFIGRVGIGKGRHTSIELDVESDTDGAGVARFVQPGATATGVIVQMGHAAAANTTYTFFEAYSSGIGGDREAYIRGDGNAFCDGTWSGGGADFAEYFEWLDGNPDAEDRRGISVTLDGGLIREAQDGEVPIGIVSAAPTITGGGAPMRWHGKYRRDAYGAYALDKGGYRVLTAEYDGRRSAEYIPRAARPEWAPVGIVGRLRMRKGQLTAPSWTKIADITDDIEEWLVR